MSKDYIYRASEVELEIQSFGTLPVAGFQLHLNHNAIPTIRFEIDPFNKSSGYTWRDEAKDPTFEKTTAASVEMFDTIWKQLWEATQDVDKRGLNFSFEMESATGDTQRLRLKDWLLTGVGVSGVSASGSFTIYVEAYHPAFLITEGPINLFGSSIDQAPEFLSDIKGDNVLDGAIRCLEAYIKKARKGTKVANEDKFRTRVIDKFAAAVTALKDTLEWKSSGLGWPEGGGWGELRLAIPESMWKYVLQVQNGTIWDFLSTTVLPQWSVNLIPTFWRDRLELKPYEPWGEPTFEIYDTDVSDITFPPHDSSPVHGTYMLIDGPEERSASYIQYNEGMEEVATEIVTYSEDNIPGNDIGYAIPTWAMYTTDSFAEAFSDSNESNFLDPSSADTASGGAGEAPGIEDSQSRRRGLETMCKQMFTESYRRGSEIVLSCRLMIRNKTSKDGYITPGRTCVFKVDPTSDKKQTSFVRFFVTSIVHTVNVGQAVARTELYGNYVTPDEEPDFESIKKGVAPNYLYTDG